MSVHKVLYKSFLITILMTLALHSEEPLTDKNRVLKREVVAHMNRYMTLANQADVKTIAEDIYQAPILMKSFGTTGHGVALSKEEFQERFAVHFQNLRENLGWDHFEVKGYDVTLSGSNIAFVKMHFIWVKVDGSLIGSKDRAACYVLIKKEHGWRTTAVMGSDW